MENSKEIEKMFHQDIAEKKRIGSNVHRRTGKGSERAEVAGGVRFAKNNFKKYEKNSKVKTYNIYEDILPYDEFNKLDHEDKIQVLTEWMFRYSNVEIYTQMKISESTFYDLRNKLNVSRVDIPNEVCSSVLNEYKESGIKPYEFRVLTNDQKLEIVSYWESKGMTNKEMAEMVGYTTSSFATYKSVWNKSKRNDGNMPNYDDDGLLDIDIMDGQMKKENDKTKVDGKPVVDDNAGKGGNTNIGTFVFNLNGEYIGKEVKEKLEALGILLDSHKEYKVNISVEEN